MVPESLAGERVDRAVALLTGWSRADVQTVMEEGGVLVDGEVVAKSRRLGASEVVTVTGEPEPATPPEPDESVPFDVRYEDEWLAVVNKPAGVVVHPGAGNDGGTLAHGLLARFPQVERVGDRLRPGIVHRLDRDTSGLLAVALTDEAYAGLVAALASRSVEREYVALVWGHLDTPRGVVDAPIGRSARVPTRMAVTPSGREARTSYRVVDEFREPEVSLLEVHLETGRTHQIRVHLSAVDHPVVGDAVYGGDRKRGGLDPGRPFLHARRLAFDHPVTGERVEVEEPLPPELLSILDALRTPR